MILMKKNNNKIKVEKAFNTLKQGVIELIQDPAKLEKMFEHYGNNYEYNPYSARNTILLMFQTSALKGTMFQMARGYKQWQRDWNRQVKKGEKAMTILAPLLKTHTVIIDGVEHKEKELIGFRAVNVFELSQTDGEEIHREQTKNKDYKSLNELKLKDFIAKIKVPVEFEDLLSANGYTDGKKIVIGKHNDDLAGICTLFHELAHYHLHYKKGEEQEIYLSDEKVNFKELEAEAVSYMVSSALGINNDYSRKYIAHWNRRVDNLDEEFENRAYNLLMEALNQIDLFIDLISS